MGNIDKRLLDELIANDRIRAGFTDRERLLDIDTHKRSVNLAVEITEKADMTCLPCELIALTYGIVKRGSIAKDSSNEVIYRLLEVLGYEVK